MPPEEPIAVDYMPEYGVWCAYTIKGVVLHYHHDPVSVILWAIMYRRTKNIKGGNCTLAISECAAEAFKVACSRTSRTESCIVAGIPNYEKVSD